MFDLIFLKAELNKDNIDPKKFGFEKLFLLEQNKNRIVNCTDIIEASQKYKNQKLLLDLRDYAFDEGAVKLLAEKKKACILINLGRVIRARGIARAILISKIRSLLRLANRYGAAYAFATLAQEEQEIRNAHELISIGTLFGINRGQAKFAIRMLGEYLTEKKEEEIVIEKD